MSHRRNRVRTLLRRRSATLHSLLGRERRVGAVAFSLVELLIVIVLTSILAKLAITRHADRLRPAQFDCQHHRRRNGLRPEPGGRQQWHYRFDVDTTNNRLVMRYTGSDSRWTRCRFRHTVRRPIHRINTSWHWRICQTGNASVLAWSQAVGTRRRRLLLSSSVRMAGRRNRTNRSSG